MSSIRYNTLLIVFLSLSVGVSAQQKHPASQVVLKGVVVDSLRDEPLVGAVVMALGGNDTLYALSSSTGGFVLRGLRLAKKYQVSVSCLGCRSYTIPLQIKQEETDLGRIVLRPDATDIEEVVIKKRVPIITMSGDTIQYNPAAVCVFMGSDAIELIRKLPGLEVDESGYVFFMNQRIQETLVNGRFIFGKDPRDALLNLPAQEVTKVQVFDVQVLGKKGHRRKKVMNLVTRSKMDWTLNANMLVSYGGNTERESDGSRQQRYGAGAEVNFFSERQQLKTNLLFNNIGRADNRQANILTNLNKTGYARTNTAVIEYGRLWKPCLSSSFKYGYTDDYRRNEKVLEQSYFPTASGERRSYTDTTRNNLTTVRHTALASITYCQEGRFESGLTADFSYARDKALDATNTMLQVNDTPQSGTHPLFRNLNKAHQLQLRAGATYYYKRRASTTLEGMFQIGNDQMDGMQVDTLTSSSQRINLLFGGSGKNRKALLKVRHFEPLSEGWTTSFAYSLDYDYNRSQRMAWDNYRNAIDSTRSSDYTMNYLTNRGEVLLKYFGAVNAGVGLGYQYARQNREEELPLQGDSRKGYANCLPQAYFEYESSENGRLTTSVQYQTTVALPSIEMIRNQVDSRNPLMLRAGNPNLKQSLAHQMSLHVDKLFAKHAVSISFRTELKLISHSIVAQDRIFDKATQLPEYGNYVAAKGALLSTYVNADGAWEFATSFTCAIPARKIGLMVRLTPQYNYTKLPQYAGEELIYTYTHNTSMVVSLRSTFSKKFDFRILALPTYGKMKNSQGNSDDFFRCALDVNMKWRLLSRCFLYAQYKLQTYHSYGHMIPNQSASELNVAFGVDFAHQNRCALSLSVVDLLNANKSFSSLLLSNYIQNSWRNLPGRQLMINFGYKFNKSSKKN